MSSASQPQQQSPFCTLPTELRHAIYTHLIPPNLHFSMRENTFQLSECFKEDTDDQKSYYWNQLESSWSTHWRCERLVRAKRRGTGEYDEHKLPTSVVLGCKWLLNDFVEWMASVATIYVNDLETLKTLHLQSDCGKIEKSGGYLCSAVVFCLFRNLRRLEIDLKFRFSVCEAIAEMGESKTRTPSFDLDSPCAEWTMFPHTLERFTKLREFHLALDHNAPCSWSIVNERAVLAPFRNLETWPSDWSIGLPRLHPQWESPLRHFCTDVDGEAFSKRIHRRDRPRMHITMGSQGDFMGSCHLDGGSEVLEDDPDNEPAVTREQRLKEMRELWRALCGSSAEM